MTIIKLDDFRREKEKSLEIIKAKVTALENVTVGDLSDNAKFNHDFYKLVDLFLQEHFPDYGWKFDVWLDKIEKEVK